MKVLVVGAGAIGGWLAGVLARGGAEVSLRARGATLVALRGEGLRLVENGKTSRFALSASEDVRELPAPDVVLFCVKAQDFQRSLVDVESALAGRPRIVTAMNGLPYWFLDGLGEAAMRGPLETIDPGGVASRRLAGFPASAAVVHASTRVKEPGVIEVVKADRLILGDAAGEAGGQTRALAALVERGGVSSPVVPDIRAEIWAKLWGNMNMNPVSALTHLSAAPILATPRLDALVRRMMEEFDAVGRPLGLALPMSADARIEITRKLGDFRTSMLNDAEAGRAMETDAILGCVVELAERLKVDVPASESVLALVEGLNLWLARRPAR